MKPVLVIFTGGTIASRARDGVISPDESTKSMLIDLYRKTSGDNDTCFEEKSPINILSENMTFSGWNSIIKTLCSVDSKVYSGIIITHGSDTLSYTSALVGMLFRHTEIPIILIASNKPLDERGSNGLFNFTSAVRLIKENRFTGVFTVYEEVCLPTRLLPADTALDRFSYYGGEPIGVSEYRLKKPRKQFISPDITLKNEVLVINPYPHFNYTSLSLANRPAAVLHTLYHSGTACAEPPDGDSFSVLAFAKRCAALDIPLYFCGTKGGKAEIYSSAEKMSKQQVKTIDRISDVAAYIKLLIAYNQTQVSPSRYIYSNIYFEML